MKLKMEETPEFEAYPVLPDDSIVPVEVVDVTYDEANDTRNWDTLSFKFKILDVPGQEYYSLVGSHLWGSVSPRLTDHPDNKLRPWLESLLGFEIAAGFELDTDDLIGRQARAIVTSYVNKKKETRNKVGALLGPKAGALAGASAAPAASAMNAWAAAPTAQIASTQSSWDDDPPF